MKASSKEKGGVAVNLESSQTVCRKYISKVLLVAFWKKCSYDLTFKTTSTIVRQGGGVWFVNGELLAMTFEKQKLCCIYDKSNPSFLINSNDSLFPTPLNYCFHLPGKGNYYLHVSICCFQETLLKGLLTKQQWFKGKSDWRAKVWEQTVVNLRNMILLFLNSFFQPVWIILWHDLHTMEQVAFSHACDSPGPVFRLQDLTFNPIVLLIYTYTKLGRETRSCSQFHEASYPTHFSQTNLIKQICVLPTSCPSVPQI